MSSQRVIVEISASRVEVAVQRGRDVVEWRSHRFARADWPANNLDALAEVQPVLTKLVAELNATKSLATVVYSTPGAVSSLTSCAAVIGGSSAEQAARLALANVADFPVDDAPIDTCVLLTDHVRKSDVDAPVPQMHILTAADAEQRAAALAALVQSAGLSIDRLIPADCVAIADAVRAATADSASEQVSAVVWIGEHTTILAAGIPGRLLFVRTIASGIESMVDSLTRPLRSRDPEAAPVNLAHDDARAMFLAVGVPTAEQQIIGQPSLAGSSLLPHLQPVLQRLSIEIKQSLRFGVPESERTNVRLVAMGPGAAISGLIAVVARISGFNHTVAADTPPGDGEPDAIDSATGGAIAALVRCDNLSIALMPAEIRRVAGQQRLRKALLAGIGVAALFIGYETFDSHLNLARQKSELHSLQSALESQREPMRIREAAFASRQALSGVDERMRKALGESPDFSAVLSILAERTPETVRINALDMQRDGASGRLSVRGCVRLSEAPDPAVVIKKYVDDLGSFPVVESVRLGATQRLQSRGHESQAFDLGVTLIALPPFEAIPASRPVVAASPAEVSK